MSGSGLSEEAVEWGFRLLAGREPLNAAELAAFRALPDIDSMRRAFTNIAEFHAFFDAVPQGFPAWTVPLFLLRPSRVAGVESRFAPPSLDAPVSQFCTAAQLEEPAYAEIVEALGWAPGKTRARWEQAWIVSTLATEGLVGVGRRGLGLQLGRDRIPACLACRGVEIVGTHDQATTEGAAETRRAQLFHPEIIHLEDHDRLVRFAGLDLTQLGTLEGHGFDFTWSVNLPTRAGSVATVLNWFEASLAALRPGGLALHVFSVNLTSDITTWELPDLVLLRRRDIEELAGRLAAKGHALLPLNTHPGLDMADERVRHDPAGPAAIRQRHGLLVSTSFGLGIRKAG